MRKKVSVDTIQRENGEKENHEVSQTALDKRVNSGSEAPLNGNHNNNSDLDDHDDDNFDEDLIERQVSATLFLYGMVCLFTPYCIVID